MIDTAGSLLMSIGSAMLPAAPAGSAGQTGPSAENGGFQGLLALTLEAAAVQTMPDAGLTTTPAAPAQAAELPAPAAAGPLPVLPASGKILPPTLPPAAEMQKEPAPAGQPASAPVARKLAAPQRRGEANIPEDAKPDAPAAKPRNNDESDVDLDAGTPNGEDSAPAPALPIISRHALPQQTMPLSELATPPLPSPPVAPGTIAPEPEPAPAPSQSHGLARAMEVAAEKAQPVLAAIIDRPRRPVETGEVESPEAAPPAKKPDAIGPATSPRPVATNVLTARMVLEPVERASGLHRAAVEAVVAPREASVAATPVQPGPITSTPHSLAPEGTVSVAPPARSEAPVDFAQLVDRLVAAREAAGPEQVKVSLEHGAFGKVSLAFTPDQTGLNVIMASANPEFVRAVEAASAAPAAQVTTPEAANATNSQARQGEGSMTSAQGQGQGHSAQRQQSTEPRTASPRANASTPGDEPLSQRETRRGIFA